MDAEGELSGRPTDNGQVPFAHDFEASSAEARRGMTADEDDSSVARELRTPREPE
jgi:hypothetical protein